MSNCNVRHRIANSNLLEYADKNRYEGFFNDLTIKVGTENIPANRLVLSCYSRYFEGMFKSILRNESVIEIRAVDGATMKALIDFIYCGSININDENVMNLLSGADYLQLEEVKCLCFEFLEANEIVLDNTLDIFQMVSKHEKSTLHEKVKKYININFNKVSKTEKFKGLSKENLITCISILDHLHANEASIYQAVVTWTRHNEEARVTEFPELFKMIKLNHMAVDFLEKIILEENLVANNPQCRKLAFAAYKLVTLEQTAKSKPNESDLISLGGVCNRRNVTVVFSLSQEISKAYPKLDEEVWNPCCLKLNDHIYIVGNQQQTILFSSNSNDVFLKLNFNEKNRKWTQVASFNKSRNFFGASVFQGTLFVSDGCNKNLAIASSEYYVPSINKWISGPQLNQGRSCHCLVTCNGCLYALGGIVESKVLSCVELLEDLKGTWQNIQPMQIPRCMFAAVNCNGVVYAVGGWGVNLSTERLKSVEKYDRDSNCWKYVADMNFARSGHAACVLRGKIYVVGGWDTDIKTVKEIECYDPTIDNWSIVGTVTDDLVGHTLVAM